MEWYRRCGEKITLIVILIVQIEKEREREMEYLLQYSRENLFYFVGKNSIRINGICTECVSHGRFSSQSKSIKCFCKQNQRKKDNLLKIKIKIKMEEKSTWYLSASNNYYAMSLRYAENIRLERGKYTECALLCLFVCLPCILLVVLFLLLNFTRNAFNGPI